MIQVTPHMRVLVGVEPADFRNGIDGLAQLCRRRLGSDPQSGTLFVFRNRRGSAIKVLVYDGRGFWLCQKRLSHGRFRWWPKGAGVPASAMEAHALQVLLAGGDPNATRTGTMWRPIIPVS